MHSAAGSFVESLFGHLKIHTWNPEKRRARRITKAVTIQMTFNKVKEPLIVIIKN
jgi:hypothetical protein